jgi:hypothetical protein
MQFSSRNEGPHKYRYEIPEPSKKQFIGFFGYAATYLDAIGFIFRT